MSSLMQRWLLAPAALGVLVLLATGCGDDDDVIDSAIPDAARSDAEMIVDGGTRAPRADFAVSGCQGISMADGGVAGQCLVTAPATLAFVSLDEGQASTFVWSFGDATPSSSSRMPTHTYRYPGVYTVGLVVGGAGGTDSVTKPGLVAVGPATLGEGCAEDAQCKSGLRCACAGDAACPLALRGGVCTRTCSDDAVCEGGMCADLSTGARGTPAQWQQRWCVPRCGPGDSCPGALTCRELPRAGAPASEPGWRRACFAAFPRDVGASCATPSGALDPGACLGGQCAALGARGTCSGLCSDDGDCPSYASCFALSRAPAIGLCIADCTLDRPCTGDPLLACSLPAPEGDLGLLQLPDGGLPTTTQVCSPRRCMNDTECGSGGDCVALGSASFCTFP